jgi:hypothetical protein
MGIALQPSESLFFGIEIVQRWQASPPPSRSPGTEAGGLCYGEWCELKDAYSSSQCFRYLLKQDGAGGAEKDESAVLSSFVDDVPHDRKEFRITLGFIDTYFISVLG